ncbi:MAG: glycosyltransferase [Syntrophobacteraceae bacterium]
MPEIYPTNSPHLLTFAVLAYNQERFIRDAIEGAFSQMYSPLEIVLSDDCSADGTFAAMEEMASSYKGPHRVIVNRNPSNLGLGGHINRVMELSTGALVVIAEGDDISLPERTSLVYQAWEYSQHSTTAIYSDYLIIDKSGSLRCNPGDRAKEKNAPLFEVQRGDLREFMSTNIPMINGCSRVWPRRLFDQFGQLPVYLKQEDFVLCFRSLSAGGILHINRPLVKYRRHDENLSFHAADDILDPRPSGEYDAKRRRVLPMKITSCDAVIHDIDGLRRMNGHDQQYLAEVEREARRIRELYALEEQMMSQGFLVRVGALSQILSHGGLQLALKMAPQVLPRRMYNKSRAIKGTVLGYLNKALLAKVRRPTIGQ